MAVKGECLDEHRRRQAARLHQQVFVLEDSLPVRGAQHQCRPPNRRPVRGKYRPDSEECGHCAEIALNERETPVEFVKSLVPSRTEVERVNVEQRLHARSSTPL